MFVDFQLEILRWIAGIVQGIPASFFVFLNFLDTIYYYIVLFPLIWFFYGRRVGFRFLFLILLGGVINNVLKSIFALPRPSFYDPSIAQVYVSGYTFPSGAAQGASLLACLLWEQFKQKRIIPWLVLYVLIMGLARNFLGVHFPFDVIAGWVVGVGIFLIYKWGYQPFEKKLSETSPANLVVPLIITCGFWLLFPSLPATVAFFSVVGASIGWLFVNFLKLPVSGFPFSFLGVLLALIVISSSFGMLFILKWAIPSSSFFKIPFLFIVLGFLIAYEISLFKYFFGKSRV